MRQLRFATIPLIALTASGCGLFGSASASKSLSVFSVRPGQCLQSPGSVQAEITKVTVVPCATPHTQEAYALVDYQGTGSGAYPGDSVLKQFADGACAERYASYVGTDYADSSLFFTYLLPSARSWEQGHDRHVLCIVTTTGARLQGSVRNSHK